MLFGQEQKVRDSGGAAAVQQQDTQQPGRQSDNKAERSKEEMTAVCDRPDKSLRLNKATSARPQIIGSQINTRSYFMLSPKFASLFWQTGTMAIKSYEESKRMKQPPAAAQIVIQIYINDVTEIHNSRGELGKILAVVHNMNTAFTACFWCLLVSVSAYISVA